MIDSSPSPVTVFIGLGANLGDAQSAILQAVQNISKCDGVTLIKQSSLYRSAPVDAGGPDFVNAVVEVLTNLSAPNLLKCLQGIETLAGRQRPYRNAPRTLDLDILIYGGACIQSAVLTVPHPRMHERAFVLMPLAEIAPDLVTQRQLHAVASQFVARL